MCCTTIARLRQITHNRNCLRIIRPIRRQLLVELRDATLPAASGTYALSCSGGAGAAVRASGRADVVLDERGLAALYTGFASPWTLRALGRLDASDATCEELAALFGGSSPCVVDMF